METQPTSQASSNKKYIDLNHVKIIFISGKNFLTNERF